MEPKISASDLVTLFQSHEEIGRLVQELTISTPRCLRLKGLTGSARAMAIAATTMQTSKPFLVVMNDREEAAYLFSDLTNLLPNNQIHFFPSSFKRSLVYGQTLPDAVIQRTDTLNALSKLDKSPPPPLIIVTYPDALVERVVSIEHLQLNTLKLSVGERVSTDFIVELLGELGFTRQEFVYEPGQFAIRGSIIDIFSFSASTPYRVDFFGDEVETIRSFDVNDQLSRAMLTSITIVPNLQTEALHGPSSIILELMPRTTVFWIRDAELVVGRMNEIYQQALDAGMDGIGRYASGGQLLPMLKNLLVVEFGVKQQLVPASTIEFSTSPQPPFRKNFELLCQTIVESAANGYTTYILAQNPNQHQRLANIFASVNPLVTFRPVESILHEGFVDKHLKICLYTDHQVFDRYHKFKLNHELTRHDSLSIQELLSLQPGDYVVHVDHGIGTFGGLVKIQVNGKTQEAVRLVYKDNDSLLVNIHSLHRISKYRGKEGEAPKIYKLGSAAWQKLKSNTKRKVKDIARELIALYAQRRAEKGFAFGPDTYLQEELEASFIYEDTPDQHKATLAVKDDMQSTIPMDRLICGDVGFGKTEIAIRAAFKAVNDSKQVAVLVPTTILALQHFQTFKHRLNGFPCTIEFVSRMKTAKAQKEVLQQLADGKIDILIGTHALLGSTVRFKNLGLLIVDEEQKFGVAAKEKLKRLRVNVDTLTLTATPIPRTLQFSLMGARDLSIINTPPPNRHPIITELHTFNSAIIKEAIEYEVSRGGQVFFVHNRVQNIDQVQKTITKLCPTVSTAVAHGQMEPHKLEKTMLDFIAGDFDVLVATTIIESGLDIPNANTIIINNAQSIGLSDLHQLRGRVGRSNKKAFCYLLAPPLENLTNEARRRLKAIEEFSELGSGFSIAMQDLDIRGAGNLLGGEQSGFITDIGFETYHRILDEAIQELREEEFAHVFGGKEDDPPTQWQPTSTECSIETDMELLIPETYVSSIPERMRLYRELDSIKTQQELEVFQAKLKDRFGTPPTQTLELMNIVNLRMIAVNLGLEKVVLRGELLYGYFVPNPQSAFFRSSTFASIIGHIQTNHTKFSLKEAKERLSLTAKNVKNVSQAIELLKQIRV